MAKSKSRPRKPAPVESMTGFGAASARARGFRAEAEIRAVNGRFLSLKVRLPGEYAGLEEELRRRLVGRLGRGNVDLRAEIYPESPGEAVSLDAGRAEAYVRAWKRLGRKLGLAGELSLPEMASLPELFLVPSERRVRVRALPAICRAATEALEKLQAMRRREGRRLARDLGRHLAAIERLRRRIARRAPATVKELVARAAARVEKVLEASGAGRRAVRPEDLARELAYWAERTDISEELDRLASHVAQFRAALAAGGQIGKRLDFLVQEMHREANTSGAKTSDTGISGLVVEMKLHVERLREQVQNVL